MKILNPRDKFLTNYEVLEHLKGIQDKYNWSKPSADENRSRGKRYTACGVDLEVITRDVVRYLENTSAGAIDNEEKFTELILFLNELPLVKIEKYQIMNVLPRLMVTLYAVVEECDARLSEDQCEAILEHINRLFPSEEVEEGAEEGEEEEQGADEVAGE